jgi:hypothetical protein
MYPYNFGYLYTSPPASKSQAPLASKSQVLPACKCPGRPRVSTSQVRPTRVSRHQSRLPPRTPSTLDRQCPNRRCRKLENPSFECHALDESNLVPDTFNSKNSPKLNPSIPSIDLRTNSTSPQTTVHTASTHNSQHMVTALDFPSASKANSLPH